jgi:hypothetical protein
MLTQSWVQRSRAGPTSFVGSIEEGLHSMTRLAAILTCLALAGCGVAPARELQAADPGAEVTLAPGAAVSVRNTDLEVRFVAVTEDSRCPRDVACIWAGEVKAQLEIRESANGVSQVEVLEGDSTAAGKYRVTLVRVEPRPTNTARIAPQDYRATLKVDNF